MAVVIIPAYRPDYELGNIAQTMYELGAKIIVVDDGSGNGFSDRFEDIEDICTVLRHDENMGKGVAIKTALTYIKNNMPGAGAIGVMDCDGQHRPEDMMRLIARAEVNPGAMILGVREIGRKMPFRSRLGNGITRLVFRFVTGVDVSDTQTGLRAFDYSMINELLNIDGDRYEYEMNVLTAMAKSKTPILEVPIQTIYRDRRNSTSHFHAIKDSVRIYGNLLKFSLISFSSFVVDYILFSGMMLFLPHTPSDVIGANIIARFISAFYNYSMNCKYVFNTKRKLQTAVQYFGLALGILILNNIILDNLVENIGLPVYVAKLLTEFILFVISWMVQNFIIFKREKTGNKAQRKKHRADMRYGIK